MSLERGSLCWSEDYVNTELAALIDSVIGRNKQPNGIEKGIRARNNFGLIRGNGEMDGR
jgi:hypothetical protein